MLACARIGAIHSVVFGGFSPQSLQDRILDSDCQTVITADEGVRGGKAIPLKANTDEALTNCPNVHTVITVKRTGGDIAWTEDRDVCYHELTSAQATQADPAVMGSEDPLFILYTSFDRQTQGRSTARLVICYMRPSATSTYSTIRMVISTGARGRRLDYRSFLHRLRTLGQWRNHADVRGSSDLS